jgi:hypothetical protein
MEGASLIDTFDTVSRPSKAPPVPTGGSA